MLSKINDIILKLEQNQNEQAHVDNVYNSFTDTLQGEMNKHLQPRTVVIGSTNNKKYCTKTMVE